MLLNVSAILGRLKAPHRNISHKVQRDLLKLTETGLILQNSGLTVVAVRPQHGRQACAGCELARKPEILSQALVGQAGPGRIDRGQATTQVRTQAEWRVLHVAIRKRLRPSNDCGFAIGCGNALCAHS